MQVRELSPGDRFAWRGETWELLRETRPDQFTAKRGSRLRHFLGGQQVQMCSERQAG